MIVWGGSGWQGAISNFHTGDGGCENDSRLTYVRRACACNAEMRSAGPLIRFIRHGQMLDDAPWEWGSTGGWCADMPEFFQGMPSGVYDNIWEDLDDSPVSWHITEVRLRSKHLHEEP